MNYILLVYYVGLITFMLNGFWWMQIRRKQRELAVDHERLRRLLIRAKLRR